jgi:DNA adenine methylase
MHAEPGKLEALRRQTGEAIWEARLKEAREREAIVGRVERAVATGCDFPTAVRRHGRGATPATVRRWADRFRSEGLVGLVSRDHGPRNVALPRPSPQLSLTIPLDAPAPSRRDTGPRRRGKRAHALVKWSGSKAAIAERLAALAPSDFRAYHEPFVGGGALFFRLRPRRAFLSDLNAELMNLYIAARDEPEALISALARHRNTRDHYYAVRGIHPDSLRPIERAARTLFLNRTCFNGIYRVNSHGLFNVPYGKQEHTTFFQPEALRQAHVALAGVRISCCDFVRAAERARPGDFVYLDPPYAAGLRGGQGFTQYQSAGFSDDDERRVADLVRALDRRGCFVMLSSADTVATRALYRGFRIESFTVPRQVGGHVGRRGRAGEIVVRNYGKGSRRPRRR